MTKYSVKWQNILTNLLLVLSYSLSKFVNYPFPPLHLSQNWFDSLIALPRVKMYPYWPPGRSRVQRECCVQTTRQQGWETGVGLPLTTFSKFSYFYSPLVLVWNWFILLNSHNLPYYARFSMTPSPCDANIISGGPRGRILHNLLLNIRSPTSYSLIEFGSSCHTNSQSVLHSLCARLSCIAPATYFH